MSARCKRILTSILILPGMMIFSLCLHPLPLFAAVEVTNGGLWKEGAQVTLIDNEEKEVEIQVIITPARYGPFYTARAYLGRFVGDVFNPGLEPENATLDQSPYVNLVYKKTETGLPGDPLPTSKQSPNVSLPPVWDVYAGKLPPLDVGTYKWKAYADGVLATIPSEFQVMDKEPDIKTTSALEYPGGIGKEAKANFSDAYTTYLKHAAGTANYFTNQADNPPNLRAWDGSLQPGSNLYRTNPFTIWARSAWDDLNDNNGIELNSNLTGAGWRNMGQKASRENFNWGFAQGDEQYGAGLCRYEWWNSAIGGASQDALYNANLYAGSGTTVNYDLRANDGLAQSPLARESGSYTVVDDDTRGPTLPGRNHWIMTDPAGNTINVNGQKINASIAFINVRVPNPNVSDPVNTLADDPTGIDGVSRVGIQFRKEGGSYKTFTYATGLDASQDSHDGSGNWTVTIPGTVYHGFSGKYYMRVVAFDQDNEDGNKTNGQPTGVDANGDKASSTSGEEAGPFEFVQSGGRGSLTIRAVTQDGKPMIYVVTPPYEDPVGSGNWRVDIIQRIEGRYNYSISGEKKQRADEKKR